MVYIISPLTKSEKISLLKKLSIKELILSWEKDLHIDITSELKNQDLLYLYQCEETKLKFFIPSNIAGTSVLYEQLEKFDWYYMPKKWEHDVAILDLKGCQKILEIGCGKGAFVKRLLEEEKLDIRGIELNDSAVRYAMENNLPISNIDIENFAKENEGIYDALCTFQVLEHVSEPLIFLESAVKLLKPKGKLIISVPDDGSFLKYDNANLLNKPPHHMTLWCAETFKKLTEIMPLDIVHFRFEPLAQYHVDWYIEVQKSRFIENKLLYLFTKIISKITRPIIKKFSIVRKLIRGHTLYVCFEKK